MKTNPDAISFMKRRAGSQFSGILVMIGLCFGFSVRSFGQTNPCGCTDLTISLNFQCQLPLYLKNVFPNAGNTAGFCDTTGMVLKIADLNSTNGNVIDGVSPAVVGWRYGVFKGDLLVCEGAVHALDKLAPYQTSTQASAFALIDTLDLWCNDVNLVNNVEGSWRVSGYRFFTGLPAFTESCGGQVKLEVTDFLSSNNCSTDSVFAELRRKFRAVDAQNNDTVLTQIIRFKRPSSSLFLPPPSRDTLSFNLCTRGQAWVDSLIRDNYRAVHPKTMQDVFLFDLSCAYSTAVTKTIAQGCSNGFQATVSVEILDWCTGRKIIDTMVVRAIDQEKPTVTTTVDSVALATSSVNCFAELDVDTTNLLQLYGMRFRDNCSFNFSTSYKIQSLNRVVNGFPVTLSGWTDGNYPVVFRSGRQIFTEIPLGRHRLCISLADNCGYITQDTVLFTVVDRSAPIMICDDQINVVLTTPPGGDYYLGTNKGLSYAKLNVSSINEGSRDNCALASLKLRRIISADCLERYLTNLDYDVDLDGNIDEHFTLITSGPNSGSFYSPLVNFVEFFCCDVGNPTMVELHGTDTEGNTTFCWVSLNAEDRTDPVCSAPRDTFMLCNKADDRLLIYDANTANTRYGTPQISALECTGTVEYSLDSSLTCGAGFYTRKWVALKNLRGRLTRIPLCTQRVRVLPVHEYDIFFPPDINLNCQSPAAIPALETYEVACDILAVNKSITKVAPDSSELNICSKELVTYTVVNWCEQGEWASSCPATLDPLKFTQVVPRKWDQNDDGDFNDTYDIAEGAGYFVLVRDREINNTSFTRGTVPGQNGVEEFFISKDRVPTNYSAFNYRERVFPATQDNSPRPLGTPFVFKNDNKSCFLPNPIWPTYSRDSTPAFSYQYTQIVRIFDNTPPEIAVPVPDTFPIFPNTCLANVDVRFKAADICPGNLTISAINVALNQGSTLSAPLTFQTGWSLSGNTTITSDSLATGAVKLNNVPEGKHDMVVSVRDVCGNVAVRRIPFVVADLFATPPLCLNGVVTGLMPGANGEGMMVVWASDFVSGPVFDCNGQGTLNSQNNKQNQITHYSINRVGRPFNRDSTGITLMCSDTADLLFVEIHGWDRKGNHNYCTTYIKVEDNLKICKGSGAASVSGIITTEATTRIEGVSVNLTGTSTATVTSGSDGRYSLPSLTLNGNYTVKPTLNKGFLNGITTFDLVLISRHILNTEPLNSPYKIIAADVNNSKTLTTLDLIQLRKLILGIDLSFPNNDSWRFIPASFVFPDRNNPWKTVFPESVSYNPIDGHKRADFIGVKIGDVNQTATANGPLPPGIRSGQEQGEWQLVLGNEVVEPGQQVEIPLWLKNTRGLDGFQFALQYDSDAFEWVEMKPGMASREFFGIFPDKQLITASWNGSTSDTVLSTLVLKARRKMAVRNGISLNTRFMAPEAYLNNELFRLGLQWVDKKRHILGPDLYPNFPNPFTSQTSIPYQLASDGMVKWTLTDVTGRLVHAAEVWSRAGEYLLEMPQNRFAAPGVYFFTMETADWKKTLRMVKRE